MANLWMSCPAQLSRCMFQKHRVLVPLQQRPGSRSCRAQWTPALKQTSRYSSPSRPDTSDPSASDQSPEYVRTSKASKYTFRQLFSGWIIIGLIWTDCCWAYSSKNEEDTPITGRKRSRGAKVVKDLKSLEDEAVRQAGMRLGTEDEWQSFPISHDEPQYARVRRILDKLLESIGMTPTSWTLELRSSKGFKLSLDSARRRIYMTEGFLSTTRSDDELAFGLGHEIGHFVAGHARESLNNWSASGLQAAPWTPILLPGATLALIGAGVGIATISTIGLCLLAAPITPFLCNIMAGSRTREREADYIGLLLMTHAGYDPMQAIPLIETMSIVEKAQIDKTVEVVQKRLHERVDEEQSKGELNKHEGDQAHEKNADILRLVLSVLGTHPPVAERMEAAHKNIPKIRKLISQAIYGFGIHGESQQVDAVMNQDVERWCNFLATACHVTPARGSGTQDILNEVRKEYRRDG